MQAMLSVTPPFDRAIALTCTMATLHGRWLHVRCECQHLNSIPVLLLLRERPAARAYPARSPSAFMASAAAAHTSGSSPCPALAFSALGRLVDHTSLKHGPSQG